MLAIRITFPYDKLEKTFSKIKDVCDRIVVYQHDDSSRVHVHALVVGCTVSTDTLKNWISKEVGFRPPKTDWGFPAAQNEQFITYMTKGKLSPVFVSGYLEDQLDHYRSKWVPQAPKSKGLVQYRLKIENPQEQKKRQSDMIEEIKLRFDALDVQTPFVLITLIRQVVVIENKTLLGRYKLRDYYDTVMLLQHPETFIKQMENFCCIRS